MRIWGQLEKAALELLGADPTQGVQGRIWLNTISGQVKIDDGTTIHSLQFSDQGGQGPSPSWVSNFNAPLRGNDSAGNAIYLFAKGALQSLTTTLKVPSGYRAGRQIFLMMNIYSADNANSFLTASKSTLITQGVDTFDSTTNQYDSTTLSTSLVGLANVPQQVILDLTDASGLINGVQVGANNILQIYLYRQNSGAAPQSEVFTDTLNDIAIMESMEVVF